MPRPEAVKQCVGAAPVRVIAVTGGKGGTGKTCMAINLATALTQLGRKVLLLDGDLGLASCDVLLGLAPRYTLEQVLTGERRLEEIVQKTGTGLQVIPAAAGVARMAQLADAEHTALINAFQSLPQCPEVLVVDTAPGISKAVLSFSQAAQEIIIVLRNEPSSLADAYAMIKVLCKQYGIKRFHVLTNMVKDQDEGANLYRRLRRAADHYLDVSLEFLGAVPTDPNMGKAVRSQRALLDAYPDSLAANAVRVMAQHIDNLPMPAGPSGRIEFFFERWLERHNSPLKVIK